MLPESHEKARLVGRVWRADLSAPSVVIIRNGEVIDVTNSVISVSDFLDNDPAARFDGLQGEKLGKPDDFVLSPHETGYGSPRHSWLAPCDFQALKACGVTFAQSMIERVIDERTSGDPAKADAIRKRIGELIGGSLSNIRAGSEQAAEVKTALEKEGLWSQYLEVGIGPDAEVFTKSQPMSAVGHGAQVGVNRISEWNNPEPEIVLAVDKTAISVALHLGMTSICATLRVDQLSCSARPRTIMLPVPLDHSSVCLTLDLRSETLKTQHLKCPSKEKTALKCQGAPIWPKSAEDLSIWSHRLSMPAINILTDSCYFWVPCSLLRRIVRKKAAASPTRKVTSSRFRRQRLEPCAMSSRRRTRRVHGLTVCAR